MTTEVKIIVAVAVVIIIRRIIRIIYGKKITDTMRFIRAVSATTSVFNLKTCIDVKGYKYNPLTHEYARFLLKGGWDIHDKHTTIQTIKWLFEKGHNKDFMNDMKWIKENPDYKPEEELQFHKEAVQKALKKYPNQGILAWDLCRVTYVAGGGYLAGFLSYKQAIKYCVKACKLLQENYSSWDDMMESYTIGYSDWTGHENEDRLKKYKKLKSKANGLYSVPWNTYLDEEDIIHRRFI
ncbi:MAG: DUF1266 domain-containing protein [Clostridiaceae bacterium]|nr:DUF1266 domain-containing protein [Clostridiaceae bacterium]